MAWTPITSPVIILDHDWPPLVEIGLAINERRQARGENPLTFSYAAGQNYQLSSFWRGLQNQVLGEVVHWSPTAAAAPDGGPPHNFGTPQAVLNALPSGGLRRRFRRRVLSGASTDDAGNAITDGMIAELYNSAGNVAIGLRLRSGGAWVQAPTGVTVADELSGIGFASKGDFIGPWLIEDMRAALSLCHTYVYGVGFQHQVVQLTAIAEARNIQRTKADAAKQACLDWVMSQSVVGSATTSDDTSPFVPDAHQPANGPNPESTYWRHITRRTAVGGPNWSGGIASPFSGTHSAHFGAWETHFEKVEVQETGTSPPHIPYDFAHAEAEAHIVWITSVQVAWAILPGPPPTLWLSVGHAPVNSTNAIQIAASVFGAPPEGWVSVAGTSYEFPTPVVPGPGTQVVNFTDYTTGPGLGSIETRTERVQPSRYGRATLGLAAISQTFAGTFSYG